MNIGILNGSPRGTKSNSAKILKYLLSPQFQPHNVKLFEIHQGPLTEKDAEEFLTCEAIVFAFPLYVDSFPSHLLLQLQHLESARFENAKPHVYAIVNCGFYEGEQCNIVLEQLKLWTEKCGFLWGQGVGIGAGEMISFISSSLSHGPLKNMGMALTKLSENILHLQGDKNLTISPNWPRWLWRIQGTHSMWFSLARKNGLKKQDLFNIPAR